MKKLTLLLIIATISATSVQALTLSKKARAYVKIGHGITAVLMGAASPIMGGCHLILGYTLSKSSDVVDTAGDLFETLMPGLAKRTEKFRGKAEAVMRYRATIQNASGGFYLASPFFFIPLGVAAIKSGREDLKKLSSRRLKAMPGTATDARTGQIEKMKIAGDKPQKS